MTKSNPIHGASGPTQPTKPADISQDLLVTSDLVKSASKKLSHFMGKVQEYILKESKILVGRATKNPPEPTQSSLIEKIKEEPLKHMPGTDLRNVARNPHPNRNQTPPKRSH